MDVLGENEALRQFFEGEDVRGVLESEGVDTSILEQYLSNDMDPSTFILPESPPDSGSEPCSPPQVPDARYEGPHSATASSCCLGDRGPRPPPHVTPELSFRLGGKAPPTPPGLPSPRYPQYLSPAPQNTPPTPPNLYHPQTIQRVGHANGCMQANTPPTPPNLHHPQTLQHVGNANGYIQANAPPTPPNLHPSQNLQCVGNANSYMQANVPPTPPNPHHPQNLQHVGHANGYIQANAPPTPPNPHHPQNLQHVGHANGYIQANAPPTPPNLHHPQNLQRVGHANGCMQANTPPTPPNRHHPQNLQRVGHANGYIQANTPPTPPVNNPPPPPPPPHCVNRAGGYVKASPPTALPGLQQASPGHLECTPSLQTGPTPPDTKKRRRSESFEGPADPRLWTDPSRAAGPFMSPECVNPAGDVSSCDSDGQGGTAGPGTYQVLLWEGYQPNQWSPFYDSSYQSLSSPGYHVDTDKGFSYSSTDEAFVCQKKNHFQVTVHIGMAGTPKYVKTPSGPKPIESFYVKVFGVKFEAQSHMVTIEQSQSDRTKKPFLPVQVSLPGDKVTKVTLGRLHFSETTANNMRKKGKPNPDQRYFLLVVGLYASVEDQNFLLVAHKSERIIVRASNPGQFENDSEPLWQRGQALDAVVCQGRVGINTEAPDEALVVCGNAKIMGTVMHPSDCRAKQNIQEVDSTEQLKRIAQMRIVEYDYRPEFALKMGIDQVHETGVIAQEVKELLPSAVKEVGDVVCGDGETIDNFLMVDKEQIFMENVGAVKQLCKLTDNLQTRIQELEVWNTRLAKLKSVTGSLRSKASRKESAPLPKKPPPLPPSKECPSRKQSHWLHHRLLRGSVIMLAVTMGICVISITALYLLNLKADLDIPSGSSNNSLHDRTTTALPPITSSTVAPSPGPWPPDVDFCNLLYCEEVYCCPSDPGNHSIPATTHAPRPPTNSTQAGNTIEQLFEKLKSAKDWRNTTVKSIVIKENQHVIDNRYCVQGNCGSGNYSYVVPISKFVPVNMRFTVQMNTTELLVVLRCRAEESSECSALMDYADDNDYTMSNTQGYVHDWPLPVAQLFQSSYHFRTAVAGKADCSTHPNYAGVLFTDYHFRFYRRCD